MRFLKDLSLRTKLVFLSLIPIVGLLYYLQITIRQQLTLKENAIQVISDVRQIEAISKVLHEFQKERALSLSYLAGADPETKGEILRQREVTDAAIFSLEKIMRDQDRQIAGYGLMDSLQSVRTKVNSLTTPEQIDPFYTDIKRILLEGVSVTLRSSQNLVLKNHFEEHLFLLYAKEHLAQLRSELGTVLARGKFAGNEYGRFSMIKGKHESNLERLMRIASPELREVLEKKYRGPVSQQTYMIVEQVFSDAGVGHFPYDFDMWWNAATSSINALKEIEDFSSDLISRRATEELNQARLHMTQNIVIAALIIAMILLVVIFALRGIMEAITKLRGAAERMARGESSELVSIGSRDEMGALAASFNQMITVTQNFSRIADAIGQGDYTPVVSIRGAADTLGIALNNMKNNLQRLAHENATRTWLLTGNGQINDCMRGEKEIGTLAQDVIVQLTRYLNAQIGAIYLAENSHLELVGAYAFQSRAENTNRIQIGQGLVGQAAMEKKPIVFDRIPPDYIRINSALGDSIPRNIIVFPFLLAGELKGVAEIGSRDEFTDLHMQFLNIVSENIAIAFQAAQSRTVLKELLEETQRQSEELEAQQEELRQSNDELLEKSRLLEKSEGELKVQQEELQQSNEELEEKANLLEEQKEKLELAKVEIENKVRDLEVTSKYKSEFLANMSHELRTPLNSILILSRLLADNKQGVLGAKEVEYCKNIHNSGADLLNLINEILDLSKVESGRMELDISPVPVDEVKRSLEAMFTEVAKTRGIDFQISTDAEVASKVLVTDKHRLEQVLRNLLSNAFKFTADSGSVGLHMERAQPNTAFKNSRLYDVAEIIAFCVTDNGIGIPAEKQDLIFEAFQQADGSTKRKYGGTGLGLSISRELAYVLGGEIQVKSQEGKGSIFTLYLPLTFDNASIPHTDRKVEIKPVRTVRHGAARGISEDAVRKIPFAESELNDDRQQIFENDKVILIMEDDLQFARILLDFVRERSYKGIVATSGNIGLSYARHYKPDAIILDINLPVMDGSEVLKLMKNDPELRHVPVQIISGYDHRKEVLELGAFDFLPKPVSQDGLKNAFDKIEAFMKKKLKKLLIIEDDEKQGQAIKELIGNGDVKSFLAHSGSSALEMMKKVDYDCVILDLGLPDMTGFELLEKVKANPELNKVPIVVYTGRDLTRDEHATLVRFANTVVLKTVDSHERLLDETMLFLHRVESSLPKEKQTIIRKLHKTDEVLKNRKVLVVDDDIRNIYSLTNVLAEQGVQCVTAENGKVALEVLKANPGIEMILMDVMMPELDGYEATKAIRAMEPFRKLPIIALTAKAMKGDREKCLSAGMSDYIAKPLNVEQLLSLMRIWLYR